ncbi:MAG: Ferredoxin reductase [Ktedonobacterales bacterium]|jgi:3-phenylpropionate/trans-cinnamate dioxygenase ferredoxin reductase subunit|nr:MAG: Ferredoxin reductase [Ktedonobacterales bacterium]
MAEAQASRPPVVVVGGGIAGASAAETLRREGFDGRIVVVGDERALPYERPPLSKEFLLGAIPEAKVFLRAAEEYGAQDIELRTGTRATRLDVAQRRVELAGGESIAYDRLLLATGSEPVRLHVPGADLPGIRYLRTLDDARALAAEIASARASGGRVVVVGAGFIGAEVAADCRMLGLDVTLIEALPVPMLRALGAEMGGVFAELHRAHGVDLRLGEGVAAFRGAGRVEEVVTTSGARLGCAFAVVGVGVRPATEWLRDAGLTLENGVVVDCFCATTAPGVFAAGDVARWPYMMADATEPEMVRLEHWDNALRQAEVAARNMLGQQTPFAPTPYFWSDQYDWKAQYVGYARTWERVVVRGRPEDGAFIAFYLTGGRICAALAVNHVRELVPLKKLIGAALDPARLADAGEDLRGLSRQR